MEKEFERILKSDLNNHTTFKNLKVVDPETGKQRSLNSKDISDLVEVTEDSTIKAVFEDSNMNFLQMGFMRVRIILSKERKGRHPRNGSEIIIPEQYRLKVKLLSKFQDQLDKYNNKNLSN